jgi:hypothetical protein
VLTLGANAAIQCGIAASATVTVHDNDVPATQRLLEIRRSARDRGEEHLLPIHSDSWTGRSR